MNQTQQYRSGIVWIIAALALLVYCGVGFFGTFPGVEQLVKWLLSLDGKWILAAAFVAIFIEGLYFVGNFFPGSTVVILVAVLSQVQSWTFFALTILAIFIGWVLAGSVNILLARRLQLDIVEEFKIEDRPWTTWFPSFRSNYEVAQIVSGAKAWPVFWSSLRVKVWASLGAACFVAVLPLMIDVTELSNEEGFIPVFITAIIMLVVGIIQIKKSKIPR